MQTFSWTKLVNTRYSHFVSFVVIIEVLRACDKVGNLPHNHRFLLQTKHKARDKTLKQRFLKEFKATCKNFGESELKQQKAIWNAFRSVTGSELFNSYSPVCSDTIQKELCNYCGAVVSLRQCSTLTIVLQYYLTLQLFHDAYFALNSFCKNNQKKI